jgi:hypothetical protein
MRSAVAVLGAFLSLFLASNSQSAPLAAPPYTLTVFASGTAALSSPDSIAFTPTNVFVAFGNGVAKDGSDGKSSTIVEYDLDGHMVTMFSVKGHNDGLRIDREGKLWSLQNEDGNPNLVIIDPEDDEQRLITTAAVNGGGYDDIVFAGDLVFFSASNPSKNPNTDPAVVTAKVEDSTALLTEALAGNASATEVTTGKSVTLNLQDPDSMILDPNGELVLTSQADMELVIIQNPGVTCEHVFVVPLTTSDGDMPMADDTLFARSAGGRILFADKSSNTVYAVTAPYFAPGAAYTAAQNSTATTGFLGQVNLTTGLLTPIVTGLGNPGGMAFISTDPNGNDPGTLGGETPHCPENGRVEPEEPKERRHEHVGHLTRRVRRRQDGGRH